VARSSAVAAVCADVEIFYVTVSLLLWVTPDVGSLPCYWQHFMILLTFLLLLASLK
jgi:hypothetical protein